MPKPSTNVPPRGKTGSGPTRRPTARPGATGGGNRPPRRAARGGRSRRYWYSGAALAVVVVVVVVVALLANGSSSKTPSKSQAAVNFAAGGTKVYGGLGPEGVPLELGTPLAAGNTGLTGATIDGIQCGSTEQTAYHHHVHLAIFVNGQPRPIPLAVGMVPPAQVTQTSKGDFADGSASCLYWLHVHATDGIVHIESPEARTFELAQVFGIWHQPLSSTQLGSNTGTVTATVDGKPWTGDPAQIPLDQHSQIVLNLGTPVIQPPAISWSNTGL